MSSLLITGLYDILHGTYDLNLTQTKEGKHHPGLDSFLANQWDLLLSGQTPCDQTI